MKFEVIFILFQREAQEREEAEQVRLEQMRKEQEEEKEVRRPANANDSQLIFHPFQCQSSQLLFTTEHVFYIREALRLQGKNFRSLWKKIMKNVLAWAVWLP